MFQLTIDDFFLLKDELVQKSDEAVERFEYTYWHLRPIMPFLFEDYVM